MKESFNSRKISILFVFLPPVKLSDLKELNIREIKKTL